MSHFVCASCDNISKLCGTRKTEHCDDKTDVSFLGYIPLDSNIFASCNQEVPFVLSFPDSVATHSILNIAKKIQESVEKDPIT